MTKPIETQDQESENRAKAIARAQRESDQDIILGAFVGNATIVAALVTLL